MVQYGKLPSRLKPAEPRYDPYGLVDFVVNGLPVQGRPFEFSGCPADANTTLDGDGQQIYPIKCVVSCPQCGDGLTVALSGPLAGPHRFDCLDVSECRVRKRKATPEPMPDPFRNPFLEGVMAVGDVDADLVNALEIPAAPAGTVAERLFQLPPIEDDP